LYVIIRGITPLWGVRVTPQIQDWLAKAWADRGNTLVYYNYKFDSSPALNLIPIDTVRNFSDHIAATNSLPMPPTYDRILIDFSRLHALCGPELDYGKNRIVVTLAHSRKLAKFIDVEDRLQDIESLNPGILTERQFANVADEVHAEIQRKMADFHHSRVPYSAKSPSPTLRRRSPASRSRAPHLLKSTVSTDHIWVTTWDDARQIGRGALRPPTHDTALAWRRILGLKTEFRGAPPPNYTFNDIAMNVIYRISFKFSRNRKSSLGLRKPNIFSGGYLDLFGTFWPKSVGKNPSGWGRTLIICGGHADDGEIGASEAVIRIGDLVSFTQVVHLGRIGRRAVPGVAPVDVRTFAEKRHRDELKIDIEAP
jgi:hypothetical protein